MDKPRHPRGLYVLFFAEMWERFSFYLLLGILPLYLADSQKGGLGWSDERTAVLMGVYAGLVYFTPFLGGILADRLLGCRFTILIGGVLMMIGHLVLAWPTETGLYLGLGFIILGNGAFKPNISTLLGNLYPPGSPLKEAGYNIFYMGINLGAFLCNFVAALVRNHFDAHPVAVGGLEIAGWHAAFATASFGMLLGLLTFAARYRLFAAADQKPGAGAGGMLRPLWLECLLPAAVLCTAGWFFAARGDIPLKPYVAAFFGAVIPVVVFYVRAWRGVPDPGDRGRVAALLVIFAVVIVFWVIFYLSSTALTTWIRDNTRREPGPGVRLVTDAIPDFAETAPPSYFANAGPNVPRPHPNTFRIVGDDEYRRLEREKKLTVLEGQQVVVTRKMFDQIFAKADDNTPKLEPYVQHRIVNPELFQSINAGFVLLFTPLLVAAWSALQARGREPGTVAKIGLGMLFTACGPLVMWAATFATQDGASKGSAGWLFGFYAVVTVGELCLSPMGLALVSKLSPADLRTFLMGGWFLSTSLGKMLSGIFGAVYQTADHYVFWPLFSGAAVLSAGTLFLLLPWLRRQMGRAS